MRNCVARLMDKTTGFYPVNVGSIPARRTIDAKMKQVLVNPLTICFNTSVVDKTRPYTLKASPSAGLLQFTAL